MNDPAESSFGGTTRQLQCYGRIGLTNAGGVDQVKRNGDLSCILPENNKRNKDGRDKDHLGNFHKLTYEMCSALLKVARDVAPIAQKQDQAALKK